MHILLVEDHPRVADAVTQALRAHGHAVQRAATLSEARAELATGTCELAVVDVALPDGSGLDFCRAARSSGHDFPILVLSARAEVTDRVAGLDAGADDYLCKPFATAELVARVQALSRRGPRWTESTRDYGALRIDRDRRLVTLDGQTVPLTSRELDVVTMLAWRDGRAVPKDEILDALWGDGSETAAASLEVLVARIRRKLRSASVPEIVRTIRNVGYAWAPEASKRA